MSLTSIDQFSRVCWQDLGDKMLPAETADGLSTRVVLLLVACALIILSRRATSERMTRIPLSELQLSQHLAKYRAASSYLTNLIKDRDLPE